MSGHSGSKKMASRGLLQLMSYFTLSISLLLLIFALSSHQATASLSSSSIESITTTSPTDDIFRYLFTAVKWLLDKLDFFIRDPRARIDTVINWIVDSIMNPFRTLKDGMMSFRRLFRYLHRLKKGTFIDFGKDNPVYKCYLQVFPGCVSQFDPSVNTQVVYHFYCAWKFYERCHLRYWWENGMWKVPRINVGDACLVVKCADQPPI